MALKIPMSGMENITEKEVFWNLRPEHRGRRIALFQLLSNVMYIQGDYDVPAETLFFGTKTLADKVLEALVKSYNFTKKVPTEIIINQPRYPEGDERYNELKDILSYLEENDNYKIQQFTEGTMTAVIVDKGSKLYLSIWD